MARRSAGLFLSGVAAAVLASGHAAAQSAPEVPAFRADTALVAVPVFVTDRGGKAVGGLTAGDFVVEDNGKPVPIVGFQAVDAGASDSSGAPSAHGGSLLRAAARRQFLILIDLSFTTASGIRRAQEAARDFVAQGLAPGDLAAVATFGAAGIKVQVAFTSDHRQLAAAISGFGSPDQPRSRDPLALAYDLGLSGRDLQSSDRFGELTPGQAMVQQELLSQMVMLEQTERSAYQARVESFIAGLDALSSLLDSVQGRKQVILLSAGFDQKVLGGVQGEQRAESTAAVAQGRLWDVDGEAHFGSSSANRVLDELFRSLAASDTVVHTVDVAGLTAGGDPSDGTRADRSGGRDTLALLAANTGGRFITGTNDAAGALREVADASRYSYVLAFEPREQAGKKARFRKVKVKVRGDGLRASHRIGYLLGGEASDAATGSRRQFQAAEVIAKGLSGGAIALRAVALPYRNRAAQFSLPVVLDIDGRSLVTDAKQKEAALEVYGYAFDSEGRIADVMALTPTLDLSRTGDSLREKGLQVLTAFRVAPGLYDLRFLVRESTTGRTGALRQSVEVPRFGAAPLTLSRPLFTDDPTARLVIPAPSQGNRELDIPLRLGDRAFTMDAHPLLRAGAAREVVVFAYPGLGVSAASLRVSADLQAANTPAVRLAGAAARLVRDADGFQRFVLDLRSEGAPPGDHMLRVTFLDPASGTSTTTEAPVRVE